MSLEVERSLWNFPQLSSPFASLSTPIKTLLNFTLLAVNTYSYHNKSIQHSSPITNNLQIPQNNGVVASSQERSHHRRLQQARQPYPLCFRRYSILLRRCRGDPLRRRRERRRPTPSRQLLRRPPRRWDWARRVSPPGSYYELILR